MKKIIKISAIIIVYLGFMMGISSCAVFVRENPGHHSHNPHQSYNSNPGKAKGKEHNSNNPHNYNSSNKGHSEGKDKGKK
jgi:ABC-type nickel/cobalt efflux system permease component RcnA